jgi:hypothetical protein
MATGEQTPSMATGAQDLLQRFKPQLRYDSQEAFFADSAAEMTDNPGNTLRRAPKDDAPGDLIAEANATDPIRNLSLPFLAGSTYENGEAVRSDDRLDILGQNYRTQYVRLREAHPELRNRMYGHGKLDSDGRLWLQYWFWYFYNDYHLAADFGLHEGDWEMIQLRMYGDQPDLAVYAQHRYAEKRPWSEVPRAPNSPDTPLVYPGRGSHASYFEPGLYETEAWFDIADGKRHTPELQLELVEDHAPPWISWPGMWGDTEANIPGLEQPSPRGPASHTQWQDPKALLESAVTRAAQRPAEPPQVAVARKDGTLHISYDFTSRAGPEPVKLVVTVNSVDEPGVPPRTFTFGVESTRSAELETRLALRPDRHYDVYLSVTAATDANGLPSDSTLIQLDPVGEQQHREAVVLRTLKRTLWTASQLWGRLRRRAG